MCIRVCVESISPRKTAEISSPSLFRKASSIGIPISQDGTLIITDHQLQIDELIPKLRSVNSELRSLDLLLLLLQSSARQLHGNPSLPEIEVARSSFSPSSNLCNTTPLKLNFSFNYRQPWVRAGLTNVNNVQIEDSLSDGFEEGGNKVENCYGCPKSNCS